MTSQPPPSESQPVPEIAPTDAYQLTRAGSARLLDVRKLAGGIVAWRAAGLPVLE
jgi:hypothetical protein